MTILLRMHAIFGAALLAGCNSGAADQPADNAAAAPAVAVAPVAAAASKAPAPGGVAGADCADEAATIFACTLSDGSLLRVCQANGGALYRFGPANGPAEITLPRAAGGDWAWASVPYSGGGEAQARFSNGQYDYIVYSRVVRMEFDGEGNAPAMTDGVMVRRNDATVADRICDPAGVSALDVTALDALQPGLTELFAYVEGE